MKKLLVSSIRGSVWAICFVFFILSAPVRAEEKLEARGASTVPKVPWSTNLCSEWQQWQPRTAGTNQASQMQRLNSKQLRQLAEAARLERKPEGWLEKLCDPFEYKEYPGMDRKSIHRDQLKVGKGFDLWGWNANFLFEWSSPASDLAPSFNGYMAGCVVSKKF